MTRVVVPMEENLKEQLETLCSEFGMNVATAFTIFAKAIIRERKIPFEISVDADDFYNEYNQAHIRKAILDLDAGKGILSATGTTE